MGGIVGKSFRANGAGLGVDVEVGCSWAGNTGLSVPDGLIKGALSAGLFSLVIEWSFSGASACVGNSVEGLSSRARNTEVVNIIPHAGGVTSNAFLGSDIIVGEICSTGAFEFTVVE